MLTLSISHSPCPLLVQTGSPSCLWVPPAQCSCLQSSSTPLSGCSLLFGAILLAGLHQALNFPSSVLNVSQSPCSLEVTTAAVMVPSYQLWVSMPNTRQVPWFSWLSDDTSSKFSALRLTPTKQKDPVCHRTSNWPLNHRSGLRTRSHASMTSEKFIC